MSSTLLLLCALAYLWVAVDQALANNLPMAGVFLAYGCANACLMLVTK